MTQFLVSVRDAAEAEIAIAGGADIIDFKDPDHGALGALTSEAIEYGVHAVAKRLATSATAGDWPLDPALLVNAARRIGDTGVDFVKLGLLPGTRLSECINALQTVAQQHRLVVVFFADRGVPLEVMEPLHEIGCAGVLIDTFGKTDGRLRTHLSDAYLKEFVAHAHSLKLFAGLAGSLRLEDIEPLMQLQPDILGFRGALCDQHTRTHSIALSKVREVATGMKRWLPNHACASSNALSAT